MCGPFRSRILEKKGYLAERVAGFGLNGIEKSLGVVIEG